ncbi:hypothetical protein AL542_03230 [Grimontia hollisae]|nr:hypothetical protein AL542_03230 [Grimontia hollisae]
MCWNCYAKAYEICRIGHINSPVMSGNFAVSWLFNDARALVYLGGYKYHRRINLCFPAKKDAHGKIKEKIN